MVVLLYNGLVLCSGKAFLFVLKTQKILFLFAIKHLSAYSVQQLPGNVPFELRFLFGFLYPFPFSHFPCRLWVDNRKRS